MSDGFFVSHYLFLPQLFCTFAGGMKHIYIIRCTLLACLLLPIKAVADEKGENLFEKADSLYGIQSYDAAEQVALQALPACKGSEAEGDCLNLLAIIYIRKGDFNQAVKYAKQCYTLDEKSGDPDAISSSLNTLAGIYMSMRQPKEAEKYVLKAIEYAKKADNPQRMAVLHGMASEVYHTLKQEERSLDYATKAYEMEQKLGRKDKMAIRQAERASALISLHRDSDAKMALDEAIPGLRESGNIHSLGIACNQMGLLMHQSHNDSAAVRYFTEALKIFVSQHDLYNESKSRYGLYEALRTSDPVLAMEHNDRYNELRDSIYDENTGELLSKYAAEYGYDELQAENSEILRSRRIYTMACVAVVALLLAILAFALWRHRRDRIRMRELIRQIEAMHRVESSENVDGQTAEVETDQADDDLNTEDRLFLMQLVRVVNDGLPSGQYGVEEVASQMNMSVQTFRRRLLSVTGESPKAFISAIQMERAAKLLLDNPDMPVSRVATLCGYDETNSFGRCFKRAYGMTPSQYRQQS